MAFLLKQCISMSSKRSTMYEINRLKYILTEIKSDVTVNKNISPVVQSRHFATEVKEEKMNEPKLETLQIYQGPLMRQVRSIKAFTILSSLTGILSQPLFYNKFQELGFTGPIIAMATCYGFFILVTPFLIHFVTRRYVIQMEYNPKTDSYTAYTYSLFLRRKKIEFTPDDVKIPLMSGMFTSHVIKGSPLFIDPRHFDEPRYYAKIMGYDKPIDFSIETDTDEQKK